MVIGILLAAGQARRFGDEDKLTKRLAGGTPVVIQAAERLCAAVPEMVVQQCSGELVELLHAAGLQTTVCPQARLGMGHSLAWAVRQCCDADGWLVALADMPFAESATIAGLLEAMHGGASLVAPTYAGRRGHPVGFGAGYYNDLISLCGDHGAREILNRDSDYVHLLPVEDPGVLADIDMPADLRRLDSLIRGA
jgi:molybdenum cofactor cytidylyltransferase